MIENERASRSGHWQRGKRHVLQRSVGDNNQSPRSELSQSGREYHPRQFSRRLLKLRVRLRDSRLGRAWLALREDEEAAASAGIALTRTKLLAYGTGAAFGGMSGAFLGSYLNTVNADQFQFFFSIFVLAMVILGGLGSIWGVVLGAIVLTFIANYLIPDVLNEVPAKVGLDFDLTQLSFGIYGFLLVVMMVLRPEGLIPERRRKVELTSGVTKEEAVFDARA